MIARSTSVRKNDARRLAPPLQIGDHRAPQSSDEAIEPGRIVDDFGAIEGRAEHGGFRYLPAIAAADAIVIDRRYRIVLERVVGMLERQRGTAGEADTGVIAGAAIFVDAEAIAHH